MDVPLGEARTDDEGHLLVLGGLGTAASPGNVPITNFLDNAGWFDDRETRWPQAPFWQHRAAPSVRASSTP